MKPLEYIRNFCIIAHIDHGKSTLADRMLEMTHTIEARDMREQTLDAMDLERERGITIKAHPVTMYYDARDGHRYQFNLIDTPGHVDFTYEVERSLAACEGALLVVDAAQGVEAQTVANTHLAVSQGLTIIPVLNKIDLPNANVAEVRKQIEDILAIPMDEALNISAKTGAGIVEVMEAIVQRVKPPQGAPDTVRALVFDSIYDAFRGVVSYLRMFDGRLVRGQRVRMMSTGQDYEIKEVGQFRPKPFPMDELVAGDVGYIIANIKDAKEIRVGDTITRADRPATQALPGFKEIHPMVFCGLYPVDTSDYEKLVASLDKLRLNDASLSYQALTSGTAAGQCVVLQPCSVPEAIVGSRVATYVPRLVSTTSNDVLPSFNLRWDLAKDMIGRAAVSRSLGRANYNELAGAVSLNDTLLTGSSGNPKLKPILSDNLDLTLAWYFAPRAYVSGGVFAQNKVTTYLVTSRKGVSAKLQGVEGALEMPVGKGFGFGANATYVDSKDEDGAPMLGTSRWTYNLRGFYEDDKLTASLAWNYRTDYAIGFVGDGTLKPLVNSAGVITQYNGQHRYAGAGSLSLSIGYRFTKDISIHLDGNNLNDPIRHTYYLNENAPGYWHQNGRQFFLALRAKM